MKKLMLTTLLAFASVAMFAAAKEARVDVYNLGEGNAVKIADKGTSVRADAEKWMQQKTRGGALACFKIIGDDWQVGMIAVTAVGSGRLEIQLRGPDVRTKENPQKNKKVYVDFSKLVVNGKTMYEAKGGKFLTVWHNQPKVFGNIPVKDGETVEIEVTFRRSAKK